MPGKGAKAKRKINQIVHDIKRPRVPFAYYGGKAILSPKLVKLFPEHKTYVDVFGGGGSLLFCKNPDDSELEIYNDIDEGMVGFFRVLRDRKLFKEFELKMNLVPYSRKEFMDAKVSWHTCKDRVDKAVKWFTAARMGFSGCFGKSWSFSISASKRGMAATVSKYLSTLAMLPEFHKRVQNWQIECQPWWKIIETYDLPDTFFYCDPPYVWESRKTKDGYLHEFGTREHINFVKRIKRIQGKAMISGYRNRIYLELERYGWNTKDFETSMMSANTKREKRTETIWCNYPIPEEEKEYVIR